MTVGRGTSSNSAGRFEATAVTPFDDGWGSLLTLAELQPAATIVRADSARSLVTENQSPDIPFGYSANAYKGCEHGCIYCYARPSHAYLNHSPGLDFETKLYYKPNAAELLENFLRRPGYQCKPISLGANTDPYQPIEKRYRVTRSLLQVALDYRQPVSIVTKGTGVLRDLDLLSQLAALNLVRVSVSVTSLDAQLKRLLEPRAASPAARLRVIAELRQAQVPVDVLVAPVIPALTDHEIEKLIAAVAEAGALSAQYILLRLPREVAGLFEDWLETHFPLRKQHVLNRLRAAHGGKLYDARFGHRMRGEGEFAELLARRFALALKRHGLDRRRALDLDTGGFRPPPRAGDQLPISF